MYPACQPGSLISAHLRPHSAAGVTIAHSQGCTAPSRRAQGCQGAASRGVGRAPATAAAKPAATACTCTSPLTHHPPLQAALSDVRVAQPSTRRQCGHTALLPRHPRTRTVAAAAEAGGARSRHSEAAERQTGCAAEKIFSTPLPPPPNEVPSDQAWCFAASQRRVPSGCYCAVPSCPLPSRT